MKAFFKILLILCSVFLISCNKKYAVLDPSEPIDIPPQEDPYNPEKDLPKEMRIVSEYTFPKREEKLEFINTDKDLHCYDSLIANNRYSDEDLIPVRFRLYNKNNKLIRESLPFTSGRRFITELFKKYPEDKTVTVWTYIPYHKDGVKIKAVLVDDTGKDLKVLAERRVLAPEEFREGRLFYQGCYRQVGFGIE
ncbi:MAG: hypothetical protein OXJ52_09900 [Oligoflexia bacterium]|nr:hypothetical protein [Oligoflexia bacterium]